MKRQFLRTLSYVCITAMLVVCSVSGTVLPVIAEQTGTSVITGGTFDAEMGDTVYSKNWADAIMKASGVTIVQDPLDATNRVLALPEKLNGEKLDVYLKGLSLETNSRYVFSFDLYGGELGIYVGNYGVSPSGSRQYKASTSWNTYTIELETGSDTDKLATFVAWGISFVKMDDNGFNTGEGIAYLDNVTLTKVVETTTEPETPVENDPDNLVKGGTFEAAEGNAVYDDNWSNMLKSNVSIVTDPKDSSNHCLLVPASPLTDYHVQNLLLESSTTYVFSFDVLSSEASSYYFWGAAFEKGGLKTVPAASEWTRVTFEIKTVSNIDPDAAYYPNYFFCFLKSNADYAGADTYIDNFSVKVKPKEVPSVEQLVAGGDFENTAKLNTNWTSALNKAAVVEDTAKENNHCLRLPKADTPIGDVYINNVWMEPSTSYFVSFDVRGAAALVYFYPNAFVENGSKVLKASDDWKTYTYKITTKSSDTYLKGGYQNYLIGFLKNSDYNDGDTYIDNVRVVRAGAYVDPDLENGTVQLSSWKDPDTVGAQAAPAAGGTVTVTVAPNEGYMLKPGSLYYVDEQGNQKQILNKESGSFGEGGGDVFRFVMPKGSAVVTAEFVPTAAQSFRFGTLGTSVYYEAGATEPSGIRFLNRLYVDGLSVQGDTVTVTYGGKTYTVTEFGSLLKRADNTTVELKLENVSNTASSATRVWRATAYDGTTMKLVDYTEAYVDFTVIMKSSGNSAAFLSRKYTACGYIVLKDQSNQTVTLYTGSKTDSADDAKAKAVTLPEKDDPWREHPQDFKLIATTFDRPDFSNSTINIERLIAAMEEYDFSATLNVAGESLAAGSSTRERQIELLTEAMSKGFEIGSYTWGNDTWATTKDELNARTYEEIYQYISDTQDVIEATLGVKPKSLRPPYLLSNDDVVKASRELGLSIITGNVRWGQYNAGYVLESTHEDGTKGASYESLTTYAHDGAIWILHAHQATTISAVEEALPDLYKQGYRFCSVADLFKYNGITMVAGDSYAEVTAAY